MRLVADANVLFSSIIRDGTTRRIWFHPQVSLCAPATIVIEFMKYRDHILRKSGRPPEEVDTLVEKALAQVKIIGDETLKPYLPAAASLISDSKDWLYLACALKENATVWSNDKGFERQKRVSIRSTTELIEELFKQE